MLRLRITASADLTPEVLEVLVDDPAVSEVTTRTRADRCSRPAPYSRWSTSVVRLVGWVGRSSWGTNESLRRRTTTPSFPNPNPTGRLGNQRVAVAPYDDPLVPQPPRWRHIASTAVVLYGDGRTSSPVDAGGPPPPGPAEVGSLNGQRQLYGQRMLTIATRVDAMNRLGRAMADPTRSRILLHLLDAPGYPARLAHDLGLTRTNVSNHLACLRGCGIVVATPEGRQTRYEIADPHLTRALSALVDVVLAVDDGRPCTDEECEVPLCCVPGSGIGSTGAGAR